MPRTLRMRGFYFVQVPGQGAPRGGKAAWPEGRFYRPSGSPPAAGARGARTSLIREQMFHVKHFAGHKIKETRSLQKLRGTDSYLWYLAPALMEQAR